MIGEEPLTSRSNNSNNNNNFQQKKRSTSGRGPGLDSEIDQPLDELLGDDNDENEENIEALALDKSVSPLPLPSPVNIFTADFSLCPPKDLEIALKTLDSDPKLNDSDVVLKPHSMSRVSFNRSVKMKEVGRYISSSSPSQRPPKAPKKTAKSSSLSQPGSSSTSKKRKIQDFAYSKSPSSNHYLTTSKKEKTQGGSIFYSSFTASKYNIKSAPLSSTGETNSSGVNIFNSSEGNLLSSEVEVGLNLACKPPPSIVASSSAAPTPQAAVPQPHLRPWKNSTTLKSKIFTLSIAFLWEDVKLFEGAESKTVNVANSKISVSDESIMISKDDTTVQLLLAKKDILTIQHAPNHLCSQYSFVKFMLKEGSEYLLAIIGSATSLVNYIRSSSNRLTASKIPNEAYARALALAEAVTVKKPTGTSSPQERFMGNYNIQASTPLCLSSDVSAFDNKVLYFWEQSLMSQEQQYKTLSNARISVAESILEIRDSAGLSVSMKLDEILDVYHAQHSQSDTVPTSMLKICREGGVEYFVIAEGGMMPLISKLVEGDVSIFSLEDEDIETIKAMIILQRNGTPCKTARGILKKSLGS